MHHSSGMIYEGMWVNGRPESMPTKLVITEAEIESLQGSYINIEVECQTAEGVAVKQG